ncbi:hypothetical protein QBC45DRAFT_405575 [Copromyces sp. CBS 386.78]|nr:hypothetical protein QBC45DRAFT_405575 [Copromyces sp. CBS 386.78]
MFLSVGLCVVLGDAVVLGEDADVARVVSWVDAGFVAVVVLYACIASSMVVSVSVCMSARYLKVKRVVCGRDGLLVLFPLFGDFSHNVAWSQWCG